MEELFEKILKKPKAYRRKLAYILTLIFGLLLFSLWMLMTMDNFKQSIGDINPGENLKRELPSLKEKYQEQADEAMEIKKELENLGY
jgi:hypothetical protein